MRRKFALLAATAMVLLLASVVVSVALPGPRGSSAAQTTGFGRETSSGIFTARYGDRWTGQDAEHEVEYVLTDGRGYEKELLLDEEEIAKQAGGTLALIGKPVTIEGKSTSGGKIEAEEIRRKRDGVVNAEGFEEFEADAAVTGHQPAATILCRFVDSTGAPPHDENWFQTLVGDGVNLTKPSIDHFWHEVSLGNIDLGGSQVFGWYNLPEPRSSYFTSTGKADLGKLAADCTQVADEAVFFPGYTTINLMFDRNLDGAAWGGWQPLDRDGQTKTYGMTWMPPWGYENQGVLAHEMGHSYGLPHSSGPYGKTYDSWWDVMSSAGYLNASLSGKPSCHKDATYGCMAMGTISAHKDRLGWIPDSRKYTAALGSNQNITIERLGTSATGNYLMAQIPISGSSTQYYTIETRRFVGYDDHVAGEAIVVHHVDTTLAMGLRPIAKVVDSDDNGNPNDAGAMLLPGEAFTDPASGISVGVTGVTTNGYDVAISVAPSNDNFDNAQAISGSSVSVFGTTAGATREVGEPDHSTDTDNFSWLGDHSVWYRWTAPFSGSTTIDTCASNIDGVLAVYTGSSLNTLSRVVDGNNACPSGWGSKATFDVQAGTTYRIAVSDAGGAQENTFTLKLALTDAVLPTVSSVEPTKDATRVSRSTNAAATFSEGMDPNTLTGMTVKLVKVGSKIPVAATVSYDGASQTVTLDPSVKLARRTKYTVTIKGGNSGVKDLAGNALSADNVWSFTTGRR